MTEQLLSNGHIPGLAYRFPIEGVIRTGYTVPVKGSDTKRRPMRDDEFSITLQAKDKDTDQWLAHPLDEVLREKYGEQDGEGAKKLRRIPVVIAFDNSELTVSETYESFTDKGRQFCVGNGCTARRRGPQAGLVEIECKPATCPVAEAKRCDVMVRLNVFIEGQEHQGGTFILRTGSYNAASEVRGLLDAYRKLLTGLAGLPMWLLLKPKSSRQSMGTIFYYAALAPRGSDIAAFNAVKKHRDEERDAGLDRDTYERTLVALRGNDGFRTALEEEEEADQMDGLIRSQFTESTDTGLHTITVGTRADGPSTIAGVANRLRSQSAAVAAMNKPGAANESAPGQVNGHQPPSADGGAVQAS